MSHMTGPLIAAAAAAPPPTPKPDTTPSAPATSSVPAPVPPAPPAPRIYGGEEPGVVAPVAIRQQFPSVPASIVGMTKEKGILEVIIDEQGRVVSLTLRSPIHPVYDTMLVGAAPDARVVWRAGWRQQDQREWPGVRLFRAVREGRQAPVVQ